MTLTMRWSILINKKYLVWKLTYSRILHAEEYFKFSSINQQIARNLHISRNYKLHPSPVFQIGLAFNPISASPKISFKHAFHSAFDQDQITTTLLIANPD